MDANKLQSKIYSGYKKAAARIGLISDIYRPQAAENAAISPQNFVATTRASFNAEDFNYSKPNKYGKATWYCVVDGEIINVGDYIVAPNNSIFFIAAMQPLLPIFAVSCNRMVSVFRAVKHENVGVGAYGGNTAQTEVPLIVSFPASVLSVARGEKSFVNLPGDARLAGWQILLPVLPGGINFHNGDTVTDELNNRYTISGAELTDLGWRITAIQAGT